MVLLKGPGGLTLTCSVVLPHLCVLRKPIFFTGKQVSSWFFGMSLLMLTVLVPAVVVGVRNSLD